jgi:adenylate kinase
MNLLIMGAPGAGKGTQAAKIVEKYGVHHVSTGDMLRAAIKENSPLGLKASEYMSKGLLVPDELVNDIVKQRLTQPDMDSGFLMDGYPRTEQQAISFNHLLEEIGKKVDAVIKLDIDEEVLVKRITGRRVCSNCKEIYHIESKKPKVEGVCDLCGGKLIQREDDSEEKLKTRLAEYHKQAKPIEDHYQGLIKTVNANQSPDEVFEEIVLKLEEI